MQFEDTIRGRFFEQLESLGVDCYTIYTRDKWHPYVYIPHDLDPNLFYPEPMSGTPRGNFCESMSALMWPKVAEGEPEPRSREEGQQLLKGGRGYTFTLPDILRGVFIEQALDTPRFELGFRPSDFGKYSVLYSEFFIREQVHSAAVFCPKKSRITGREEDRELLFFNFRTQQEFSRPRRHALALLANAILNSLFTDVEARARSWDQVLVKTIQCQSMATRLFNESLVYDSGAETEHFINELLKLLRQYLKRKDENMLASVYLLESDGVSQKLKRFGKQVGDKKSVEVEDMETQPCKGKGSITVCTTVTGRAHLLNYVDPEGHTSVELTLAQYRALLASRLPHDRLILEPGGGRKPPRLVLMDSRQVTDNEWQVIQSFLLQVPTAANVYERLRRRASCQYADIFGELDLNWNRPCSEVCVPIAVGSDTIGCINVESSRTYRFNPSSLNVLASVGTIIGAAVVQRDRRDMLNAIQRCAELFHTSTHMNRESLGLDELAKAVARNLGCQQIAIDALAGPILHPEYHRLAASHPSGLGSDGVLSVPPEWREFIVEGMKGEGFRGIVVTNDFQAPVLYRVYAVPPHESVEARDPPGSEAIKALPETDEHLSGPSPKAAEGEQGPTMVEGALGDIAEKFELRRMPEELALHHASHEWDLIMGIPLVTQQDRSRPCDGIMWASYLHRKFSVESARAWDKLQRDLYLGRLLDTARRCSIIPVTLGSKAWEALRYRKAVLHGKWENIIAKISTLLVNGNVSGKEDDHATAVLLTEYIRNHVYVTNKIFGSPDLAALRATLQEHAPILSIKQAIEAADGITQRIYQTGKERIHVTFLPRTDYNVRAHGEFLRELLVMILSNCVRHGRGDSTATRVEIECAVDSASAGELLCVTIRDKGSGFGPDVLGEGREIPWWNVDGRTENGFGLVLIRQLAAIMSDRKPQMDNASPEGGARWRIWLPFSP
jgi:hypothetical protein